MARLWRFYPSLQRPAAAVPGVHHWVDLWHRDVYTGEKADLVAAGLLPAHLFPGEPDMPKSKATLYAEGAPPVPGGGYPQPGSLEVTLLPATGRFTIRVAPDALGLARRRKAEESARSLRLASRATAQASAPSSSAPPSDEADRIHRILCLMVEHGSDEAAVRAGVARWLAEGPALRPARSTSHLQLVRSC